MLLAHPLIHPTAAVHYPVLDPLGLILYVAFFIATTLVTMRRPAYGLCVLIAVQPFALYEAIGSTTITLSKVAVLAVLLGLCTIGNAFAPLASKAPWRVLAAGLLVLGATLLSYHAATYHAPVLREAFKAVDYLLLFCASVAAYRLDPDVSSVRVTIFFVGAVVALLALTEEVIGSPSGLWINGHVIPRIAGPLEGPNQLAGYFDVAFPAALALTMVRPTSLGMLTLGLISVAEVLTFSRGGMFAAIAALLAVALTLRKNLWPALAPVAAGVLCGLGVTGAWTLWAHSGAASAFRFGQQSDYAGGVGTRSELWRAAFTLWKQHPIFGIGAGNFEREIPLTGLKGVRTHANSLYIQSLVEGGVPLIAATLWLVYTSIATFARDRMQSPFVIAAFAASIALALHQIVDFLTFYPKVGGEWWIVMALGAAELAARVRTEQPACA